MVRMFVYSKMKGVSRNLGVLTQSFTSKNIGISQTNNRNGGSRPISLLLGAGCGLLAALLYLKKEDSENFLKENKFLAIASCLDTEAKTKTEYNTKHNHPSFTGKKTDVSKKLRKALKRTDQKLLVFKEKHGWFHKFTFIIIKLYRKFSIVKNVNFVLVVYYTDCLSKPGQLFHRLQQSGEDMQQIQLLNDCLYQRLQIYLYSSTSCQVQQC